MAPDIAQLPDVASLTCRVGGVRRVAEPCKWRREGKRHIANEGGHRTYIDMFQARVTFVPPLCSGEFLSNRLNQSLQVAISPYSGCSRIYQIEMFLE